MKRYCLFILIVFAFLHSCKEEESISILQDSYGPKIHVAEDTGKEFVVSLNASPLQTGEKGEWAILSGEIIDDFVYIEDKNNPSSSFKGIPGEEYRLEWTHWNRTGKTTKIEYAVQIPSVVIEISDVTPEIFSTIITLSVDPKFKGVWSFDKQYGHLNSRYHDGRAEPPENKPIIELHGYANTTYTATFTYRYANRDYKFQKVIKTGNYTEDEGLYELQIQRGSTNVIENREGKILELKMQASGIAYKFNEPETYPALTSFKSLRKLILGGSSLRQIPAIFGDHFPNLEELDLDRVGRDLIFPDNFGNLAKLKHLVVAPLYFTDPTREIILPKSFANLKSLETFDTRSLGYLNFNGTMGGLINLKFLSVQLTHIPDEIGDLKRLQTMRVLIKNPYVPASFGDCEGLLDVRLLFLESQNATVTLPSTIEGLKKLESFEITTKMLYDLPESFSELTSLRVLRLGGTSIENLPESFGNLLNLEDLTLNAKLKKLPDSFCKLSKLSILLLNGTLNVLPEDFGDLTSLTYFSAKFVPLKKLPDSFGKLKKLKEIDLYSSSLEYLPESFGGLDNLEKLNLAYNQLKNFPSSIIPLSSIKNITLTGNMVGDIPDQIERMKPGVIFFLYQVPNLTLERMNHVIKVTKGKTFYTDVGYFSSN